MNGVNENKYVRLVKQFLFCLSVTAMLLVAVGVVIRLTVRDAFLATAIPYYMTSPASMTLMMFAAVFALPSTRVLTRRFAIAGLLLLSIWTATTQWESNPPSMHSTNSTHKLMFWNVWHGHLGWEAIVSQINAEDPDIIALAEIPRNATDEDLLKHFPDYEVRIFPRNVAVLSRIPISDTSRLAQTDAGIFEAVTFQKSADLRFTLVLVDIASELRQHRKTPIGVLNDVVGELAGPVLIAGDFNTPVDSCFIDSLRAEFKSAFEEVGTGLHATWPMPLPVLAIDHVWGNAAINFRNAKIVGSIRSDHRAIIADFIVGN